MSTICPSCPHQRLQPVQLDYDLPALACGDCGGALLSLVSWRNWREHATLEPPAADAGGAKVSDSASALRCPKCERFMTKFRFAADARNQIDFCTHCDEVWLDHGEWELLERFALTDQLSMVFSQPWQNRVRSDEARLRQEERWRAQFGADFARVRDMRAWIAAHPKAREILAYLYLSQTER